MNVQELISLLINLPEYVKEYPVLIDTGSDASYLTDAAEERVDLDGEYVWHLTLIGDPKAEWKNGLENFGPNSSKNENGAK